MGNISRTLNYSVAVSLTKNNSPVLFSQYYSENHKKTQYVIIYFEHYPTGNERQDTFENNS